MRVLAGDIGGTKTNIGLYDPARLDPDGRDAPAQLALSTYDSRRHDGLEEILDDFLSATRDQHGGEIAAASFGIAGPVKEGRVQTLNIPWIVEAEQLSGHFGIPRVTLHNDLEAMGLGIPALRGRDLVTVQRGSPPRQLAGGALLAAGTGMGMALLIPVGGRWQVQPTEGGHVELAPRSPDEAALLDYLFELFPDHVSVERAVSGPGLVHLYHFVRDTGRAVGDPEVAEAVDDRGDRAGGLIGDAAIEGRCAACDAALDLFVSLYGSAAGNLALTTLAFSGIFLGGGIAPKILPRLLSGPFIEAFHAKGRYRAMMKTLPVQVILDPDTGLHGAAREARRVAAG
jgi:glucokinase